MRRTYWIGLLMVVGFVTVAAMPSTGVAQEEDGPLADEPSVRHKVLYRATRFEIQPSVGMTLGEPYLNNFLTNLNLSYYFTNELGIGISGGVAPLQWETDLAKNTRSTLAANDEDSLQELAYSYPQFQGSFEFKFIPIFGKFSLMNQTNLAYDLHLVAGVSLIQEATQAAVDGGSTAPDIEGVKPAGTFGVGFRMFVSDSIAVNVQLRDHLYTTADAGGTTGTQDFRSNWQLTSGVSFFVPQSVKISR